MTTETITNRLPGIREEKPWRPADYPPLATNISKGRGSEAVGTASSVITPEHVALIAHLRARIAAQEHQLQVLADELQRLRAVQTTPAQYGSADRMIRSMQHAESWLHRHFAEGTR